MITLGRFIKRPTDGAGLIAFTSEAEEFLEDHMNNGSLMVMADDERSEE